MIEFQSLVLVGRTEPATEDNHMVRKVADAHGEHAARIFEWRWPEKAAEWDRWNVVGLVGRFGQWKLVEFQRWEGLGERAVPVLRGALRFWPDLDVINPEEVSRVNPPVLHRSWKLLPPSGVVHRPHDDPRGSPKERPGWVNRLRAVEIKLDRLGLLDHPLAGRLRDWERLLDQNRVRLDEGEAVGRFALVDVPERDDFEQAS